MGTNSKLRRRIASFAVVACVAGFPVAAQRTQFDPSIAVGVGYADNVNRVATNETSDTVSTVSLDLPVTREWSTGSMRFAYNPSYSTYSGEDQYDNDAHRLGFNLADRVGRRTSIGLDAAFSRTQETAGPQTDEFGDVADDDPLLTQRTERDSAGVAFSIEQAAGKRWSWGAGANWASRNHEAIPGAVATDPDLAVEDRTEYGGSIGVSREVSRATSIGLEYAHRRFDLDRSGTEDSDLLSLTVDRQFGRKVSLGLAIGGFRSTGAAADGPAPDDERTEVQGSVELVRSYENSQLALSGSHQPTSGDHLAGTSTNTDVGLTLAGQRRRSWSWDVGARYLRREPTDPTRQTLDTTSLGGGVERRFVEQLALRVDARLIDQSGDPSGDRSALSGAVNLVWYPLGRRNLR